MLLSNSTGQSPCTTNNDRLNLECLLRACNKNIRQTLKLADDMIRLADQGDADREDVGCGILYGILRDSAYKLKQLAEKEKNAHIKKGWWNKE
jgi:hypothetical protein